MSPVKNPASGLFQLLRRGLSVFIISALVLGCDFRRGPDPDVPLLGPYVLGSYEAVNGDGYFVARGAEVVVSSSVREIGIVDEKIVGRVEDAMVGALARIDDGYFILDATTGKLTAGLSKNAIDDVIGKDVSTVLMSPSKWKP